MKPINELTPEQKRVKIAEICKWQSHHGGKYCSIDNCEHPDLRGRLFDPLISETAMREAEKAMNNRQRVHFRLELYKNSDGPKARYRTVEDALCHATALERADAFLKVKGIL